MLAGRRSGLRLTAELDAQEGDKCLLNAITAQRKARDLASRDVATLAQQIIG